MDIKGKITLFPKMRGKVKYFEGSLSSKDKNGKYVNCSLEFKFGNKEKLDTKIIEDKEVGYYYVVDIQKGFLSVDTWEDKLSHKVMKKVVAIITEAKIIKSALISNK